MISPCFSAFWHMKEISSRAGVRNSPIQTWCFFCRKPPKFYVENWKTKFPIPITSILNDKNFYLVRKRFGTKVVKITQQASFLEIKVDILHLIHHLILFVNSTKLLQTYKYNFGGDIECQRKGFHFQINKSSSFVTWQLERRLPFSNQTLLLIQKWKPFL